ncbi:uncharacterized protein isoform X2 [Musca autumnalis]|uniref:uncharacterized protein isoform X2 n=1 Tax=Musca autumnalis TaxID=221902 RepID=UPI003CEAB78D
MEIVNSSFRRQKFIKFYGEKDNPVSYILPEKPSLHEILLHEKHDFEAKVMRAATRKKWLKGFLNTLVSRQHFGPSSRINNLQVKLLLILLFSLFQKEKNQQNHRPPSSVRIVSPSST